MRKISAIALFISTVLTTPAAAQCLAFSWTTLGTAGGPVPTVDRSEPANLLTAGNRRILVDTGDGTVNQLAKVGLELGAVDTVFLSHLHLDHAGGLAAVIGLRWMNQFPGVLTVYGPPGTKAMVDGIVASMAPPAALGFGLGKAPPEPAASVRAIEIGDGSTVQVGDVTVRAAANSHFDHAAGSSGVSLSYRFILGDRSITYTGDTGPSDAVTRLATNTDLFVSEVIALDELLAEIRSRRRNASPEMLAQMTEHLSTHHLSPSEIGRMAASAGAKRIVLTHYAVPGPIEKVAGSLRSEIAKSFAGQVELSRDLATFEVGCSK
jgi:ribonuclease BN (tRNA processing enzyme)